MRVAPISCFPSDPSAKALRRALDGFATEGGGPAEAAEAGEYLHFERWGLNDDYIDAILSAAECRGGQGGGLRRVRHINLSENRLTAAGISRLAQQGPLESLRSLGLASNCLGERGAMALQQLLGQCGHLRDLDLSGNPFSDAACEGLCQLLARQCPELEGLSLARCRLGTGPRCGAGLGGLLGRARRLGSLDLHWNWLHGEAAHELLSGLYANGVEKGGQLRRLNLAWNRLGGGSHKESARRRDSRESAKLLADVFRDGGVLFHLDLSYNGFVADDCALLADGIQANHSLFGLHLVGNEATVDAMGFVVPLRRAVLGKPTGGASAEAGNAETWPGPVPWGTDEAAADAGPGVGAIVGERLQARLNELVHSVPAKLRPDHPTDLSAMPSGPGVERGPAAPTARDVLRQNPALRSMACDEVPCFSEQDLRNERLWAQECSRVRTVTGSASDYAEAVQRNSRCCWICERWVEHSIEFVPEDPFGSDAPNPEASIQVLYSIDGFSRPTVLTRVDDDSGGRRRRSVQQLFSCTSTRPRRSRTAALLAGQLPGRPKLRWEGVRMLPPSLEPLEVIFLVDGVPALASNLARRKLEAPRELVPPASVGTASGGAARAACEVSEVNLVWTGADAWRRMALGEAAAICVLDDPGSREAFTVVPRKLPGAEPPRKRAEPRQHWSFETSIFKDFQRDSPERWERCLQADWDHSRLPQLLRTDATRTAVLERLRRHYPHIACCFMQEAYAGFSSVISPAGVSSSTFRHLIVGLGGEGPGQLVDHHHCKPGDIDCIFTVANMVDKTRAAELPVLPSRGLSRFQFLEAIQRLAFRRYITKRGPECGPEAYESAIESLLSLTELGEHFMELRKSLHELLFQEEVCLVYRENLSMLRALFEAYSASNRYPGTEFATTPTLSYVSWMALLADTGACDRQFSEDQVGVAFALGKELHEDETSDWRHMALSWSEFLVALGAVVRLRGDFEAEQFEDGLDQLFLLVLEERHQHLRSRSRRRPRAAAEFKPLLKFVERMVQDLAPSRNGRVGLMRVRQLLGQPEVRKDLRKLRFTGAEIEMLLRHLEEEQWQEQGQAGGRPEDSLVSADDLCSSILRLKESLRGIERAIGFIERAFEEADADHSGSLDCEEFRRLFQAPALRRKLDSVGLGLGDVDALFEDFDEGGLCAVTMEGVLRGLLRVRDPARRAERGVQLLERHFREACAGAVRSATAAGLSKEQTLEALGSKEALRELQQAHLREPDWATLFEELDADGSGTLDWSELSAGMNIFWQNSLEGPPE